MHVYFHHHLSDKRRSFFFTSIAYLLSNTKGNRRHLDQPCLGTLADVMRIACPACPTRALPAIYSTRLKRLHMYVDADGAGRPITDFPQDLCDVWRLGLGSHATFHIGQGAGLVVLLAVAFYLMEEVGGWGVCVWSVLLSGPSSFLLLLLLTSRSSLCLKRCTRAGKSVVAQLAETLSPNPTMTASGHSGGAVAVAVAVSAVRWLERFFGRRRLSWWVG